MVLPGARIHPRRHPQAATDGTLPPRVAAGLVETIARAVGYIHGRGLLHLDLKPSNILLDGEEDGPWDRVIPRVSDFGLALSDSDAGPSETSLAGIRGTPSYMAPEQASGSRAESGRRRTSTPWAASSTSC